jgi:hypothetical protein
LAQTACSCFVLYPLEGGVKGLLAMVVDWDGAQILNQKVEVKTRRWRGDPETKLTASAGVIGPRAIRIVASTFPSHRIIKLMMLRAYMTSVR